MEPAVADRSADYSAPVATILYSSGRIGTFSAVVNGLAHGASYAIAVRAFNAVGEEANTVVVMIKADGAPPEIVDALSAVATNQDT